MVGKHRISHTRISRRTTVISHRREWGMPPCTAAKQAASLNCALDGIAKLVSRASQIICGSSHLSDQGISFRPGHLNLFPTSGAKGKKKIDETPHPACPPPWPMPHEAPLAWPWELPPAPQRVSQQQAAQAQQQAARWAAQAEAAPAAELYDA